MQSAVLCADIGTSSLKAALISPEGDVFAFERIRFDSICQNKKEASPKLWFDAFCEASLRLTSSKNDTTKILGICISGNGPTVASENGQFLLWNIPLKLDKKDFSLIKDAGLEDSLFLPRILMFKKKFPDFWEKSNWIFSGPEQLIWQLTGRALTILPEKRFANAYWNPESAAKIGIEANKIPPFVFQGEFAGNILEQVALNCNLPFGTPVFCGGPDFSVALIGTGTVQPGIICDRAGSSEGLNLCIGINPKEFVEKNDLDLRVLPSVVSDFYNASYLIPDSGVCFSQFKSKVAPNLTYNEFVQTLLESHNKFIQGRQLMKKIALQVKNGLDQLEKLSQYDKIQRNDTRPFEKKIITSGGQAKNNLWLQYKSNITGYKIEVTSCPDAELMGNAILAYRSLGFFKTLEQGISNMVKVSNVFIPNENTEQTAL